MTELTVVVKKEFICANYHFYVGTKFSAYEKEDFYVVKCCGDMLVPKNEFDEYFQIISTKIYDVSC